MKKLKEPNFVCANFVRRILKIFKMFDKSVEIENITLELVFENKITFLLLIQKQLFFNLYRETLPKVKVSIELALVALFVIIGEREKRKSLQQTHYSEIIAK